jgi:hypothetical protein
MLTIKRIGWAMAVVLPVVWGLAPTARALTRSDRPAAIVVYPHIEADIGAGRDTIVQLSSLKANGGQADSYVTAHCFYINANNHCTNTGVACTSASACVSGDFVGSCVPSWSETDFNVVLSPGQPLAWSVRKGLSNSAVPLRGKFCTGQVPPGFPPKSCRRDTDCNSGQTCSLTGNAGTLVPPAPENPFIGELKCIEVDPATSLPPADVTNDLIGEASLEQVLTDGTIDVAKYNAIGITSNGTNPGGDTTELTLQAGSDFEGCAPVLIMDHLFDQATDPINENNTSTTDLTLVPCSEDLATGDTTFGASTAQFIVFNEFEQRFSAIKVVNCFFHSQLSRIDTTQPQNSVFNAVVAGTVAGQTRIKAVGGGLLGVARVTFTNGGATGSAAYNIHQDIGERAAGDTIKLP